ncbi:MAG TPA: fibronectin/fibrinogen-binding protein, partial [Tepidimicrobium sp.]|nr:fibronectin/fibrinogen-binding protein [Tepidimicrobium sp.]
MSLDGMVTNAIVDELKNTILGGRIDKIYQYDRNEILINVYNQRKNNRLAISANPSNPRIHLTDHTISNPSTPPMFCMLLRKHLMRGIILNIEQHSTDRIIFIDISSVDDLGQPREKRLAIEIMGRHSNIILLDKETGNIIDSIRRVTHNISRVRQVLPGIGYQYPKTDDKLNPLYLNRKEFYKLLDVANKTTKIYRFFYLNYLGLGPLIGREICFLSGIDSNRPIGSLIPRERESLFTAFISIIDIIKAKKFKPLLIQNPSTDKYQAFYAIDIEQFRGYNKVYVNSISKALDIYYRKN